jgi:hypothetical protein
MDPMRMMLMTWSDDLQEQCRFEKEVIAGGNAVKHLLRPILATDECRKGRTNAVT